MRTSASFGTTVWRAAGSATLDDFDACVHLAGEPLAGKRWSPEKRQKILLSRTIGTASLAASLAGLLRPPPVFLSASAVGFYGNRGEELLDEGSPSGKGFLPQVCEEWEKACRYISDRGSRVISTRFGLVLGPGGGILKDLIPLYRIGLGGRLGPGSQWLSWIALFDLCAAIDFLLRTPSIHGPVNLVSPHAVRQKEFCVTLAKALHRPALCHVPAWALRLFKGKMADELLLASARAVPKKLCASGFQFKYPELIEALKKSLH